MIRNFTMRDYNAAIRLWENTEFMGGRPSDEREKIKRFLRRNRGLSKAAFQDGKLIGTALCGHNGRRGLLFHVAVDKAYRRRGVASMLVKACLDALKNEGIERCHIMVFESNEPGKKFWKTLGWQPLDEIKVFSTNT